ncbi:phosphomevalonate kinase [Cylas formicarius]|uniref:phosphomevalonate kinase n=1 Tax=Cylas formicarius TaxID=197179 RepID=UPI002958A0CA|nr:phosphomevalonate kinase [Cylas formicarius]
MEMPRIVLLLSGKRKSGKDYICDKIKQKYKVCEVIRISGPLKRLYAEHHQLDYNELLSDGPYKEKYRLDMINWSDHVRHKDYGYFCRAACEEAAPNEVWIISDVRRKTDIKWFRENYRNVKTIRIAADVETRAKRGWKFCKGVDDVISECDLDDFDDWDLKLSNNNNEECEKSIEAILCLAG